MDWHLDSTLNSMRKCHDTVDALLIFIATFVNYCLIFIITSELLSIKRLLEFAMVIIICLY